MIDTPEQIAIKAAQDEANKKIVAAGEDLLNTGNVFGTKIAAGISSFFTGMKSYAENTIGDLKGLGEAISKDTTMVNGLTNSYLALRTVTKTPDLFPGLTKSMDSFGGVSQQIAGMGSDWIKFVNVIGGKYGGGVVQAFLNNAAAAEKAQQAMIGMLAAGGNLSTVFNKDGQVTGDLTTQTLKYVTSLGQVAEANGRSLASTIAYADSFNGIPGVMQENVKVSADMGGEMSALSASLKVLSGSGRDQKEMMEAMDTAYKNVGNSIGAVTDKGQKGLALFSMMSILQKDLKLDFSESSGFLKELAQQFKFVGDNTEAAARIMMRFTEGLRNTGLTSSASLDIIKTMTSSVANLTTGTKAFISARSGGPGGLQGSVQIDRMQREGKSDQVMMMVLDTMKKQFGGRIVTQAEGAQSQSAAAEFTKQKMMLQSGAFGNLVGTGPGADEKATRLLEMLAKGDIGGAAKTSKEAVSQVATQGNSLQQQTNTILNKMSLGVEKTAFASQSMALNGVRVFFGGEGKNATALSNQMKEAAIATRSGGQVGGRTGGEVGFLTEDIGNFEKGAQGRKADFEKQRNRLGDQGRKLEVAKCSTL